jgi:hypothetical protein
MTNKSYPNGWQSSAHPRYGITLGVALVLAALNLAFGSPADSKQPASAQFEGSLDKVEVVSLGGWAWDASQPSTAIKVEIYDDAT